MPALVTLAVILIAGLGFGIERLIETDKERAVAALVAFAKAAGKGDGARACELLTELSRRDLALTNRLFPGGRVGCAAAVEREHAQARGNQAVRLREMRNVEEESIADDLIVAGDRAHAEFPSPDGLLTGTMALRKEDGEWRVDLREAPVRARVARVAVSRREVMRAADTLCRSFFGLRRPIAAELGVALEANRPSASAAAVRRWRANETRFLAELEQLGEQRGERAITDLIELTKRLVAALAHAERTPRTLYSARARPYVVDAEFGRTAARHGFARDGCAAPNLA